MKMFSISLKCLLVPEKVYSLCILVNYPSQISSYVWYKIEVKVLFCFFFSPPIRIGQLTEKHLLKK